MTNCNVERCQRPIKAFGRCHLHHRRWKIHGDPMICKKPRAESGKPYLWLLNHVEFRSKKCLLWPFSFFPNGRAKIRQGKKVANAARVMCELANGQAPSSKHETAHSCGNGHLGCVHPGHIRWATKIENEKDKIAHGTRVRGEQSPLAKLTENDVREIRLRSKNETLAKLADEFGISISNVSLISLKRGWKHVP